MKKIFTAVFAVLMLATAVQAQQNSNVQLQRRNANVQQTVDRRAPLAAARPAALPFAPKAAAAVTVFPYYEGFEHHMAGWTLIDADGDEFNFQTMAYDGALHGSMIGYSQSYYSSFFSGEALTPDNWMISPKMVIPDSSHLQLTWSHMTIDPEYPAEHYSVYVATGNTIADFTDDSANLKYTYTFAAADSVWSQPDAIDLSAYAGQEIYIAFRHYDCTDEMAFAIDDIVIGAEGAPIVDIHGDDYVNLDSTLTLTAEVIAGSDLTYVWTSTLGTVTGNGPVATINYTVEGIDTVTVTVTAGNGQSSTATYIVHVVNCNNSDLPYFEGFESGRLMCWTLADLDTNDVNWSIYTNGHNSNYSAGAYYTTEPANNWLISKRLHIPQMDAVELSFYYAVATDAYPEDFRVLVSTNGNAPDNFNNVVFSIEGADNTEWKRVSIPLTSFVDNDIYIAFNHLSEDQYLLYIDDIYVGEPLPPALAVNAPARGIVGEPVAFKASVTAFDNVVPANIHWHFNDTTMLSGDSVSYTWENVSTGDYDYYVAYFDNFGYDTVRGTIHLTNCSVPVSEYPYTATFEAEIPCWTYDGWENEGRYFASVIEDAADVHTLTSGIFTIPNESAGIYEVEFWLADIGTNNLTISVVNADDPTANPVNLFSGATNFGSYFVAQRFSLAPYCGQNIRFVLTHTGSVEVESLLGIMEMHIRPISAPTASIVVPVEEGRVGEPVTLTSVVASAVTPTYQWTIAGATPATATTQNVTATWSAEGTYIIQLIVTNPAGSDTAEAELFVRDCSQPISQFPATQDFENGLGCWEMYSPEVSPDEAYFGVFGLQDGSHSGTYTFIMDPYDGEYFDHSQYLISPEINCGGVDRGVELYVMLSNGPDAIPFEIRYSTTDKNISSFNNIARASGGNFTTGWTRFNAVLPAAAKYIAISYTQGSMLQNYIFFDDVKLLAEAPTELTGIESVGSVSVSIFPNPATTTVSVKAEGLRQVEMLDINGRVVLTSTDSDIDISALASGVYMVRTITNDGVAVNRIVKK
ncbi:MAG: choice-of-anchor J domain-containing protein [Bacteroidales bacterium]|nr:choice-of-anchor J domain-containing protein [Bacteroidales bacterium]